MKSAKSVDISGNFAAFQILFNDWRNFGM